MGLAGWEITDGKLVILVDPYISRLDGPPGDLTPPPPGTHYRFTPQDIALPDTGAIDSIVGHADFILVTHAHYVHMMDVPYIARTRHAILIGNESVTNIARACSVADTQLVTVRGGEDYEFSAFSVRVIPSLHSAAREKRYFSSATAPPDLACPLHFADFVEGGTLGFLIRLSGIKIFILGSMNFLEREVAGLRPDVAILPGSSSRLQIHDYAGRLLRALGRPPMVLVTHWDKARIPYPAPQDSAFAEAEKFVREIHNAGSKTRVIIPPRLEPIRLTRESR